MIKEYPLVHSAPPQQTVYPTANEFILTPKNRCDCDQEAKMLQVDALAGIPILAFSERI